MSKKKLRKCFIAAQPNKLYYYHGSQDCVNIKKHPEDPKGDILYLSKSAIIEDIETGRIDLTPIIFINFYKKNQ